MIGVIDYRAGNAAGVLYAMERLGIAAEAVHTAEELEKGKFKEAKHIPLNELRDRLNELDSQQEYIVSCHSGLRSYLAERILKQSGYHVKNLDGAFSLYQTVRPEELIYPNK